VVVVGRRHLAAAKVARLRHAPAARVRARVCGTRSLQQVRTAAERGAGGHRAARPAAVLKAPPPPRMIVIT
jgi:hypothetical protein